MKIKFAFALLVFLCAPASAGSPSALMTFSGIRTGMEISQIKRSPQVSLDPNHGGRGCDYYTGTISHGERRFNFVMGFQPKTQRLAEYSIELPLVSARSLSRAFDARYSHYGRERNASSAYERSWKGKDRIATIKSNLQQGWLIYTDLRYQCDSQED